MGIPNHYRGHATGVRGGKATRLLILLIGMLVLVGCGARQAKTAVTSTPTVSGAVAPDATRTAALTTIPDATDTPFSETGVTPTRPSSPAGGMSDRGAPEISSFSAVSLPDGGIKLTWEASGERATLCPLIGPTWVGCRCLSDIPLAGWTSIGPEEIIGNYTGFELSVHVGETTVSNTVSSDVACPDHDKWFLERPPVICPGGPPLRSSATAQRFQGGMMIRVEALDAFYILLDSDQHLSEGAEGRSTLKSLRILSGPLALKPGASPDNRLDETPPAGHFQPVSDFGLIWRGEVTGSEDIREQLGWAQQAEYRFDTDHQCQASCGASWDCYLRGPDGEGLHLYYLTHAGQYWEQWSEPATVAPTPAPTSTPEAPSATPTGPEIVSFQVAPTEVDPGDTVTLTWEGRGDRATLCPTARFVLFTSDDCRQMAPSGATTFVIPAEAVGFQRIGFLLTVETSAPAAAVTGEVSVAFKCERTWFFSDAPQAGICPLEPVRSFAAAQRFERGTMIWLEDLGRTYILEDALMVAGDDKRRLDVIHDPLDIVRDTSSEVAAPLGLYAPVSGFGLIWRGDVTGSPGYHERLGWGLAPEFGYQATLQCDSALPSGGRSWQTCYLQGPDGEVVLLHPLGGWMPWR